MAASGPFGLRPHRTHATSRKTPISWPSWATPNGDIELGSKATKSDPPRLSTRLLFLPHWSPMSHEKFSVVIGRRFNETSAPALRNLAALLAVRKKPVEGATGCS